MPTRDLEHNAMLLLLCSYLSDKEALLHVPRLNGPENLHGFILALAGLQLLPGPQHALQQHQTHTEDYLHSWEREKSQVIVSVKKFYIWCHYNYGAVSNCYRHRGTCPRHAAQRPRAVSWRRHT